MKRKSKISVVLATMMVLCLANACGNNSSYTVHDIVIGEKKEVKQAATPQPSTSTEEEIVSALETSTEEQSLEESVSENQEEKKEEKKETKTSTSTTTSTSTSKSNSSGKPKTSTSTSTSTHVHAFGEWKVVRKASCDRAGEQRRYCSCGEYESAEIPKLDHVYGEWREYSKPTLDYTGQNVRQCTLCGNPEYQTVPKLKGYTIEVHFFDAETGEEVPSSAVDYYATSDQYSYQTGLCAENSNYTVHVAGFNGVDYKYPDDLKGTITENLSLSVTLYPKYRYEETTATVATVKSGGIYYYLDGKYYSVSARETTSSGTWMISYYVNGTFLLEQPISAFNYNDPCQLAPIYTRYEN